MTSDVSVCTAWTESEKEDDVYIMEIGMLMQMKKISRNSLLVMLPILS